MSYVVPALLFPNNECDAAVPPTNGKKNKSLYNPLLLRSVNNVLTAASIVGFVVPPVATTSAKYAAASGSKDIEDELGVGVGVILEVGVMDGVILEVGVMDGVMLGVGVILLVGVGVGVTSNS
jgi:hypothetical protein